MQQVEGRVAKFEDKVLTLVAKAKPKALSDVGYIEERGRLAIRNGQGIVKLYFPESETRRSVRFSRRLFVADRVELVRADAAPKESVEA